MKRKNERKENSGARYEIRAMRRSEKRGIRIRQMYRLRRYFN